MLGKKKKTVKEKKLRELLADGGYVAKGVYAEERPCLVHMSREFLTNQLIGSEALEGHPIKEIERAVLLLPQLLPELEPRKGSIYLVTIENGNVIGVAEVYTEFIPHMAAGLSAWHHNNHLGAMIEQVKKEVQEE